MDDATRLAPRIARAVRGAMIEFNERRFPRFVSPAADLTRSAQHDGNVARRSLAGDHIDRERNNRSVDQPG
jgi:hypothetical protein